MSPRRVLVTGGGSGIGAATCEALQREGIEAIPADLNPPDGGIRLDVRDEESWAEVVKKVGAFDGLVTCAGIRTRAVVNEMTVAEFDDVFAVNVRGSFLGIRAASRQWIEARTPGAIVTVSSVNGLVAIPGQAHYAASKAAMVMFTKAAALDLAVHNIRLNSVAPGAVRTGMTSDRLKEPGQMEYVRSHVPLRRVGEPDEISPAILFLLSDGAGYISGTTLLVDGGWAGTAL